MPIPVLLFGKLETLESCNSATLRRKGKKTPKLEKLVFQKGIAF